MIVLLINDVGRLPERSKITDENEDYPNIDYKIVKKSTANDWGNDSKTLFYFEEGNSDLKV